MRATIIKKIIFTIGVFFLMNILLLLSIKGFQTPTDKRGPVRY
jgi:hypothetical protein